MWNSYNYTTINCGICGISSCCGKMKYIWDIEPPYFYFTLPTYYIIGMLTKNG